MDQDLKILKMAPKDLVSAWETCIQNGMRAKIVVEDELAKGMRANVRYRLKPFFYLFSFLWSKRNTICRPIMLRGPSTMSHSSRNICVVYIVKVS